MLDQTEQRYRFCFRGTGREYFRIWVVNLLLWPITLGAWSKVRRMRYFYGCTEVADDCFEYDASPIRIFKWRLIAVVMLYIYYLATNQLIILISVESIPLQEALLLKLLQGGVAFVGISFAVVYMIRFNAVMSRWGDIRFSFDGTWWKAVFAYGILPFMIYVLLVSSAISMAIIMMPYFKKTIIINLMPLVLSLLALVLISFASFQQARFSMNGHFLGQAQFRFGAKLSDFWFIGFIVGLFALLPVIVLGDVILKSTARIAMLSTVTKTSEGIEVYNAIRQISYFALFIILYIGIYPLWRGLKFRSTYRRLELDGITINNDLSIGRLVFTAATNVILFIVTLGFYYPWLQIRMTRLLIESLELTTENIENIENIRKAGLEHPSAFGEGFGDIDL